MVYYFPPPVPPPPPPSLAQVPYCDADGPTPNCGDKVLPPLFFIACHFVTAFIAIKLFLVVVADAYNAAIDTGKTKSQIFKLTRDAASQYRHAWRKLDPAATHYLPVSSLAELVLLVEKPLGLAGAVAPVPADPKSDPAATVAARTAARRFVEKLAVIPNAKGLCHFHAVLHAMVAHASKDTTAGAPLGAVDVWGSPQGSLGLTLPEIAKVRRIVAVWRRWRAAKGATAIRS
jgi:hypothetical protein